VVPQGLNCQHTVLYSILHDGINPDFSVEGIESDHSGGGMAYYSVQKPCVVAAQQEKACRNHSEIQILLFETHFLTWKDGDGSINPRSFNRI